MWSRIAACAAGILLAAFLCAQVAPMVVPPSVQQQRLIHQVRPIYPKLARQAHIQGKVRLAVLIDETGNVNQVKLISGHPLLVSAAMEAAKQWRYLPATRHGLAVPVRTTVDITFAMKQQGPAAYSHSIRV